MLGPTGAPVPKPLPGRPAAPAPTALAPADRSPSGPPGATWIDELSTAVGRAAAWLLPVMLALAAGNALLRHIGRALSLSLTSNALLEAQWMLFSGVFLLGSARSLRDGAHVRIDLLSGRLGRRGRAAVELLGGLLCLLPFCAFAVGSTAEAAGASVSIWEGSPDPGGLPRWPIKIVVVVGFSLLGLQGLSETLRAARALRAARGDRTGEDRAGEDRDPG